MKFIVIIALLVSWLNSSPLKDMMNRDVTIKNNSKILAIGPGALRLLSYMNLQNNIVGIENIELSMDLKSAYRTTLDETHIKTLPIIGDGGAGKLPNLETIISLNPDIIFASFLSLEQINMIQNKTKIPIVALSYGSSYGGETNKAKLQSIKESLSLIGRIMDKKDRAKELIDYMDSLENELANLINSDLKFYIGGIGFKGARGINSSESHYPSFELLGLTNSIKSPKIGHIEISVEELIHINPDIIFLDLLGKNIINDELKSKNTLYKSLNALQNNKVFWLYPYNFYNTNIENVYINSFIIASKINPDIDIIHKQKEIYNMFLGSNNSNKLEKINITTFE